MLHYYFKMFEYFPKISYNFDGISLEVTDIFRSVNLVFDKESSVLTTTSLPGERPDQLASRLYQTPSWYWSIFLTNNIKNPYRQWAQTKDSYIKSIENEYNGWVYQFANTSQFLPYDGYPGFTGDVLKSYDGTNLDGIIPGDILIYETGSGSFGIKCYGVGGVTQEDSCGIPHLGQSLLPDTFDKQNEIIQISAGTYFSAALDSRGYIYIWGQNVDWTDLPQSNSLFVDKGSNLYQSRFGGFSYIKATGNRLFAIFNSAVSCFGECSDFNSSGIASLNIIKKIAGTKNAVGGVAITTNNSAISFGNISAPPVLSDVDCGNAFCVGIVPGADSVVAFGSGVCDIINYPVVTGITAVCAGAQHALALDNNGTVYGWGCNEKSQLNISNGQYKSISAGESHSSLIDYNNNLVIAGQFLIYGESHCPPDTGIKGEIPIGLSGAFSSISSGNNHIILKQTGENKKYVGVVDSVDSVYKRIFVNFYDAPDDNEIIFNDPSGTTISVWRYDEGSKKYKQIKTIQHQLLSVMKYINSTKYIQQNGQILDISYENNWKNIYLQKYKNPEENDDVITIKKECLDIDLYNKTQIKNLSYSGVLNLENAIKQLFSSGSDINEIRISSL